MDSWRQSVSSSFMVQKNGFKRSSSGIDGTPKQWEAEFAELRLEKKKLSSKLNGTALFFYDHIEKKENVVILSLRFSFPSSALKSVLFFRWKQAYEALTGNTVVLERKIVSITFEKKGSHIFILLPSSCL